MKWRLNPGNLFGLQRVQTDSNKSTGFLPKQKIENNTLSEIPDLTIVKGPVKLPQKLGMLGLADGQGNVIDCLVYETSGKYDAEVKI